LADTPNNDELHIGIIANIHKDIIPECITTTQKSLKPNEPEITLY
jgi:hypothetical protein